jgi:YD repeat-containing protein
MKHISNIQLKKAFTPMSSTFTKRCPATVFVNRPSSLRHLFVLVAVLWYGGLCAQAQSLSDDFNGGPGLDSKWTQVNWNGSLIAYDVNSTKPGNLWTRNNFGSDLNHAILQSLPSGDFSAVTKIRVSGTPGGFDNLGIMVTDNNAGNGGTQFTAMLGYNSGWILGGVQYTNFQNYNSTPTNLLNVNSPVNQDVWVRMRRSGTSYYVGYSYDGNTWSECNSTGLSFTPVYIGLFTDNNASGTQLDVWFDFFTFTSFQPTTLPPGFPFSDNFDSNSLNSARWSVITSTGTVADVNQHLEITSNQTSPGSNAVRTVNTFDFTDRSVQIQVVNAPSNQNYGNPDTQLVLTPDLDSSRAIFFSMYADFNGPNLRFFQNGDYSFISYSSTDHQYWRLRHDPTNNTINFETSADGQLWTRRRSVTPAFPVTALYALLVHGTGATGSQQSRAIFDNFRVSPDAANDAPTVSITNPANNAFIGVGSPVNINASASDGDGSIRKVEFFQGSTKLGESTTAPYGVTWSNVPIGNYLLTAKATDNGDATSTSNPVSITVGTLLSGVITRSDGTTPISGASVKVYQGGSIKYSTVTDASGSYSVHGIAAGTYAVAATATGYAPKTQTGVIVTQTGPTSTNLSLDSLDAASIAYSYDQLGRLVAVVDPSSNTATYSYDSVGNLLAISRFNPTQVSISGFTPSSGPAGTSVTINGTGFSSTATQNAVTFNGTAATVTSSSSTQIVTSVPTGATTGAIGVTEAAGSATSSMQFVVPPGSAAGPSISGFNPAIATAGTALTINGANFDPIPINDRAKVNDTAFLIGSANSTAISTSVPASTGSGHVSVATKYGKAISSADLYVPPSPYAASNVGTTGRMSLGGSQAFSTTVPGQIGMVLFDASAGQQISLNLTSVSTSAQSNTTSVTIYDPFGASLTSTIVNTTSNPPSGTFIDQVTAPYTGSYTVLIDPHASITFGMTLNLYNAADLTGTITTDGTQVSMTTTIPGQNVRLTFAETAGRRVSMTSNTPGLVSILNPDGSTLLSPSNGAGFFEPITLPVTGTYTILLNPGGTTTGTVSASVWDVVDFTAGITPSNPPGTPSHVTITTPGQNGLLTFSGSNGQQLSLQLANVANIESTNFPYVVAAILGPNNATVAPRTNFSSDGVMNAVTLNAGTGTYTVLIDPVNSNTGSVDVTLFNAPDVTGNLTINGTAQAFNINVPGQSAKIQFTGTSNQGVTVTISNDTIGYVNVKLLSTDGQTVLGSLSGSSGTITATLPSSGTYTIYIQTPRTGSVTVGVTSP